MDYIRKKNYKVGPEGKIYATELEFLRQAYNIYSDKSPDNLKNLLGKRVNCQIVDNGGNVDLYREYIQTGDILYFENPSIDKLYTKDDVLDVNSIYNTPSLYQVTTEQNSISLDVFENISFDTQGTGKSIVIKNNGLLYQIGTTVGNIQDNEVIYVSVNIPSTIIEGILHIETSNSNIDIKIVNSKDGITAYTKNDECILKFNDNKDRLLIVFDTICVVETAWADVVLEEEDALEKTLLYVPIFNYTDYLDYTTIAPDYKVSVSTIDGYSEADIRGETDTIFRKVDGGVEYNIGSSTYKNTGDALYINGKEVKPDDRVQLYFSNLKDADITTGEMYDYLKNIKTDYQLDLLNALKQGENYTSLLSVAPIDNTSIVTKLYADTTYMEKDDITYTSIRGVSVNEIMPIVNVNSNYYYQLGDTEVISYTVLNSERIKFYISDTLYLGNSVACTKYLNYLNNTDKEIYNNSILGIKKEISYE